MMDGGMGGCKSQRVTFDVDLVGSSSWMRETSLRLLATHPCLFRPYLITRYFTTQTYRTIAFYMSDPVRMLSKRPCM